VTLCQVCRVTFPSAIEKAVCYGVERGVPKRGSVQVTIEGQQRCRRNLGYFGTGHFSSLGSTNLQSIARALPDAY